MQSSLCRFVRLLALVCLCSVVSLAQFTTPMIDGALGANEYGTNNCTSTDTAQTWCMTWDDSNLYVAITNANLSEGALLYVDHNPVSPVNGGTNADGNLSGFPYDFESVELPFRADFVTYFKNGYREYRTANGTGGWSDPTANYGGDPAYASGAGNVREVAIPWSAITNGMGRPASFIFLGFLTSSGGYIYGSVPTNQEGFERKPYVTYYQVTSTADGASTPPFSVQKPDLSGIDLAGLRHDTFDPYYRSPFGAVPAGSQVTLRFRTAHFGVDSVTLRVYNFDAGTGNTTGPNDYPLSWMENIWENGTEYDVWTYTLTTPSTPTILYYKFKAFKGSTNAFYSDDYSDDNDNLNMGGTGSASPGEPFPAFQIDAYDPNFQTPAWLANANVYHIFPDRFRNGTTKNDYCRAGSKVVCPTFYGDQAVVPHTIWNEQIFDPRQPGAYNGTFGTQFYGGDLKGIKDKLDYIQSLGFDAIYLNPIFEARSNHRYDTDNYLQIDPALGDEKDFHALATEASKRGIRLILDGVFNHSSSDSLYFDRYHRYATDGACESLTSMWRAWYQFFDANVPCSSADYNGWFGFDSLPVFDHANAAVRNFFYRSSNSVVRHWYDAGASGWRFDVANELGHDWWKDFRPYAKAYKPDGPLVGEIWPNAAQWLAGDQLDSVMNYRFRKNVLGFVRNADYSDTNNNGTNRIVGLKPSQFDHALRAVLEDYPPQASATMLNLLDSHDTNRALYVLTEAGDTGLVQAKERLKLAALFQFTYLGAPMVYYGDEAGMNAPSLASDSTGALGDPYNRAPYPWLDESGDPSIYGPPDRSLIGYYTRLAHVRKHHRALRTGSVQTLLTGDTMQSSTAANTYAFARVGSGETAIVALNNGNLANSASIPVAGLLVDGTTVTDALSGKQYTVSNGAIAVALPARSGALLLSKATKSDEGPDEED